MPKDESRGDELLRRARQLRDRSRASEAENTADSLEQYDWLARKIRRSRKIYAESRSVLVKLAPLFRPFRPVFSLSWRAFKWSVCFATCNKNAGGDRTLSEFSPRRLAILAGVMLVIVSAVGTWYVYGTRERGRFIISNYQLVDAGDDSYQMGGCPKTQEGQTECESGESEIMLVHPDWLSTIAQALGTKEGVLGIDAFLFDEIAGGIPQQGECDLGRYGIYLRPPPLFRFLRGTLKRHVISVGTCEIYGIRAEQQSP